MISGAAGATGAVAAEHAVEEAAPEAALVRMTSIAPEAAPIPNPATIKTAQDGPAGTTGVLVPKTAAPVPPTEVDLASTAPILNVQAVPVQPLLPKIAIQKHAPLGTSGPNGVNVRNPATGDYLLETEHAQMRVSAVRSTPSRPPRQNKEEKRDPVTTPLTNTALRAQTPNVGNMTLQPRPAF